MKKLFVVYMFLLLAIAIFNLSQVHADDQTSRSIMEGYIISSLVEDTLKAGYSGKTEALVGSFIYSALFGLGVCISDSKKSEKVDLTKLGLYQTGWLLSHIKIEF